ncbi:hypothetical protein AB0G14_34260, partial [Micromonospora sp. NPDC023814]
MSRSQPDAADSGEQSWPPVPAAVHEALQQTPRVVPGSAVVVWAAMLRHRQPLTTAQIIDSTVLDQSAITSASAAVRYVQALRGLGLLVARGKDGQAVRYQAVVPQGWSPPERQAATDWLDRQPPPAPPANTPPVPAAVHEALQQTPHVVPGSAVVVWAAMLRHRQPLTTTQIIDSTVLNQSAVTSPRTAALYVQALRGLGLLVERGKDGQAVRYQAVVPPGWSSSERQAATDWLERQPPPASSANTPPVPAAVHEALQQTPGVAPGSAVVVWAAMLRHRQPLTTTQIIDSTVLNQSAVTSASAAVRYVQALRGLGLLVERGNDGNAVRYEAVVPPGWSSSERQAATDWLERQPPPAPSAKTPPVPAAVHEALQQTPGVAPGSVVVVWAAMLRHRQPLTIAQIIDSTVLDQSAVTGTRAAALYVQVLRGLGLLVERGKDGKAVRYEAVVPAGWSSSERQAATDWLERQPPPASSANTPPVPEAVHEALQQTPHVVPGSAVVVWAAMLRHRQPLTTTQIIDSTVLDQSAVTSPSTAGLYVKALRGQGLLDEQGKDGKAVRYQAVVPPGWSSSERQAATDWLERQPPPAPSANTPPAPSVNTPPVPAPVHDALQQADRVVPGSAVVVWAAMLRHRQPLTTAQITDSTVLDQSAVTSPSAAGLYVQALRGLGLLVERGNDGRAVRYEAVVPPGWSSSERQAATDWLERQPPPAPSANTPPVPAAVHEALQQTPHVVPGSAVVVWAAMLRHRQPLTTAQIIDSTVLDQSAITSPSAAKLYVQALRGLGLLVERGKDGKAVRYQAVVPAGWSPPERQAATDWLERQPPPASSANTPPVPAAVHEALQQTPHVVPGSAVVVWAAMLRHRQPLTTAQIIDSTVLDQSAVTGPSAAVRYVQVLRGLGLLVERGNDGRAVRYQAVVPQGWSSSERQAATGWLERQPPPVSSANTPPVPAAVHDALQQTLGVVPGSAVVVWAAMLRHRQPLTTAQIIDSTVLDQSAITGPSTAKLYVQALRGQGLLVAQGKDGNAVRYQAVVPPGWSPPERQAATDWLDRQPPPAPTPDNPSSDLTIAWVEMPHDHQPALPPGTLSAARTWLRVHGPHWNAVLQQHATSEILELWDRFTTTTTFPYSTLGDYTAVLEGAWLTYDQLFQAASDTKIAIPSPNTVFGQAGSRPPVGGDAATTVSPAWTEPPSSVRSEWRDARTRPAGPVGSQPGTEASPYLHRRVRDTTSGS